MASRLKELQDEFVALVKRKKDSEDLAKVCSDRLRAVEQELLEQMIEHGQQNIKTESGTTLYRAEEQFAGVADGFEKEDLVRELANIEQFADLVKTSVDLRSLNSRLKEIEKNGDTLDPQVAKLVKITKIQRIRHRG